MGCKQLSQKRCATCGLVIVLKDMLLICVAGGGVGVKHDNDVLSSCGFMQDPTKVMPPLFSDLVRNATLWRICNSDPEVQVIVEDMRNDVARVGVRHYYVRSCKAERLSFAPSIRLLQIKP